MCELMGMSANVPTDICFSFAGLMQRGGRTGPHRDGWGVVFYEGKGYRLFRDSAPSSESELASLLRELPIKSCVVISHIRKATRGTVSLENTHPFVRELWGRSWCFAHNGTLKGIRRWPLDFHRPVGTTDSEHAFCWLINALRSRFRRPPRVETFWRHAYRLACELNTLGSFNFLLSDGRYMAAFCSTHLSWLTRCAPFGEAELVDDELRVDFSRLTQPSDVVTVVATRPLTRNEIWTTMAPGSMVVFADGRPWLAFGSS
ncbi:MAG TPA: class II glutamine amidotransferase [Gammaproteobacteria bacterium]|nr:class II glutamine amidotransferase [Gammaproteobacteria bacterium]